MGKTASQVFGKKNFKQVNFNGCELRTFLHNTRTINFLSENCKQLLCSIITSPDICQTNWKQLLISMLKYLQVGWKCKTKFTTELLRSKVIIMAYHKLKQLLQHDFWYTK